MTHDTPTTANPLSTSTNKAWRRKMIIFALILVGLGLYGLFDAAYAYPRRGYRAAESLERDYLKYLSDASRLSDTAASIDDPAAELSRTAAATSGGDVLVQRWLTQLAFVNKLTPEHTKIPRADFFADGASKGGPIESAAARLEALRAAPHAEPLQSYDIPVQWLICLVGFLWGAYILGLLARVARRSYSWDPVAKRLTIPGGISFTPADILEIDKRKWHKFFVTLTLKPDHPQLGGKALELDLLRFVPLEDWVLEMERIAFPEDAEANTGQDKAATPEEAV
jgi:hypothetical protein